jgi:hypothetical protein
MNGTRFARPSLAPVVLLAALLLAAPAGLAKNRGGATGVLPPDSSPYGKTYGEWAARWWRWALEHPVTDHPVLDQTGEDCAEGQQGKVWFLAGNFGGGTTVRSCTVKTGTPLLIPVLNTWADNFGEPVQYTEQELIARCEGIAAAKSMTVEIDGEGVANVEQYRVAPTLFHVDCRGSGLVLVPSVMGASGCFVLTEPPAQPTLFYPAQGVTATWARDSTDVTTALGALLGPARARILLDAHEPRTTSQVASDTALAISTASHHLTVLRDAGLLASTREGARVLHRRTPLGEAMVGAVL